MKEHRNISRFDGDDPAEAPPTPASRRFARLVAHPAARRLSRPRILLAGLAGLAVAIGLAQGGAGLVRFVQGWLYRHPTQQLAVDRVRLDPEPDPWIKSGRSSFERAISATGSVSLPGLVAEDVSKALRLCPWVKSVERVEAEPGSLTVRLTYYQPVAVAKVVDAWVVVDRDATLLPADDIAWEPDAPLWTLRGRSLPLIVLSGFPPPAGLKPGSFWGGEGQPDPLVRDAARLADFLGAKARQEGPGGLRFTGISPPDPPGGKPGVFAFTTNKIPVFWDSQPGGDAPGQPAADDRWAQVRDWLRAHPGAELRGGDYLFFQGTGVAVQKSRPRGKGQDRP